jgi:hypothetical protein
MREKRDSCCESRKLLNSTFVLTKLYEFTDVGELFVVYNS